MEHSAQPAFGDLVDIGTDQRIHRSPPGGRRGGRQMGVGGGAFLVKGQQVKCICDGICGDTGMALHLRSPFFAKKIQFAPCFPPLSFLLLLLSLSLLFPWTEGDVSWFPFGSVCNHVIHIFVDHKAWSDAVGQMGGDSFRCMGWIGPALDPPMEIVQIGGTGNKGTRERKHRSSILILFEKKRTFCRLKDQLVLGGKGMGFVHDVR
mmetsp:Transcript_5031/g.10881  ORF Transcript_5031/g.10881 Transcript_5031/m.10881 type:complete len:206 (+) Transcript_5031:3163-3780(+)